MRSHTQALGYTLWFSLLSLKLNIFPFSASILTFSTQIRPHLKINTFELKYTSFYHFKMLLIDLKLSYTQANISVWYRQLIWTIYKIKYSKNIQELKTQANFRVWEIWVFVLPRCGYKKGTMTIAFIHCFHDVFFFFFFFPSGEYSILSVDSPCMSLLYS